MGSKFWRPKSKSKTGQIPLLSLEINGHNSIIFHSDFDFLSSDFDFPILTFFILKLRYLFWLIFWCLAPFLLRGLTWVKLCAWTQNHPKKVGTCPALLIIKVSKIIGLNPPPPPPPPPLTKTKLTEFHCLIKTVLKT